MTSWVTTTEGFYFWYGGGAALECCVFSFATITLINRWFEQRRGLATGLTRKRREAPSFTAGRTPTFIWSIPASTTTFGGMWPFHIIGKSR
jgi:hypothetical protein